MRPLQPSPLPSTSTQPPRYQWLRELQWTGTYFSSPPSNFFLQILTFIFIFTSAGTRPASALLSTAANVTKFVTATVFLGPAWATVPVTPVARAVPSAKKRRSSCTERRSWRNSSSWIHTRITRRWCMRHYQTRRRLLCNVKGGFTFLFLGNWREGVGKYTSKKNIKGRRTTTGFSE